MNHLLNIVAILLLILILGPWSITVDRIQRATRAACIVAKRRKRLEAARRAQAESLEKRVRAPRGGCRHTSTDRVMPAGEITRRQRQEQFDRWRQEVLCESFGTGG